MDALLKPFYYNKKLTDPIDTARDKWNLLPAFLRVKGLVKQHIDSFNYFTEVSLKKIVKTNNLITSDIQPQGSGKAKWIEFVDIRIGRPTRMEDVQSKNLGDYSPNECRLRELTYAAPIFVDINFPKQDGVYTRRDLNIGRLPIMLRSSKCVLHGQPDAELVSIAFLSLLSDLPSSISIEVFESGLIA